MNQIPQIKRRDDIDSLAHSAESRLFATILFSDNPANEAVILDEVPDKKLSFMGRKVKGEILALRDNGKLDTTRIQSVFVGRKYRGPPAQWFFACMGAAPSTVTHPFRTAEIGVTYE